MPFSLSFPNSLFLPGIYSQQLFAAFPELQLIFTLSDTMAALKCHCTCPHLSSSFSVFVIDPMHCSLGCVAAKLKQTKTELSPPQRLLLSRCSSWCSSGFRKFSVTRKLSAPNIANISFASMGKSKNLLRRGSFPVILIGNAGSSYAAAGKGAHFLCCREKRRKSNAQTKQGTRFRLICHSLLNSSEIYCHLDSISLCLLIWLRGWFIKAQHHTERCPLVRRVTSCRHISFSFPTWLWDCGARWAFAGCGVTRGQFCWGGVRAGGSAHSSPLRAGEDVYCLSGGFR